MNRDQLDRRFCSEACACPRCRALGAELAALALAYRAGQLTTLEYVAAYWDGCPETGSSNRR